MLEALAVLVLIALLCTHKKLEPVGAFFASGMLGIGLAYVYVAVGIRMTPRAWFVQWFLFCATSFFVLYYLGYLSAAIIFVRYFAWFFFPLSFGAVVILWLYRNDLSLNPAILGPLFVPIVPLYIIYRAGRNYGKRVLIELIPSMAAALGTEAESTHDAPDRVASATGDSHTMAEDDKIEYRGPIDWSELDILETADGIAQLLRELRIVGRRNDTKDNPLARATGDEVGAEADFLRRFNEGEFPDLVEADD